MEVVTTRKIFIIILLAVLLVPAVHAQSYDLTTDQRSSIDQVLDMFFNTEVGLTALFALLTFLGMFKMMRKGVMHR